MRLGEGGYVPSLVWEKNPLKKTPVVAPSPNPSPNPSSSLPSLPSHFPAAYLSTRHKHICKSIRGQAGPHGGARMLRIQAVQWETCVESRGARMGGREERRRSCHYSGRESSATLCPTLPLGKWQPASESLWQFESMSLVCHLNALQGGGREPRQPREGACAWNLCLH